MPAAIRIVLTKLAQIRESFPRLVRIWVNRGYEGENFMRSVMDTYRGCVAKTGRINNPTRENEPACL